MKDKIQQAKDYLHQISDDIINAQNIYNTGNEAFDGILNFYAEKYMKQYKNSKILRINSKDMESALKIFNLVRNQCAHDERLYNSDYKNIRVSNIANYLEITNYNNRRIVVAILYLKILLNKDYYKKFHSELNAIFKQYKNGFKTVSFEDILNIMGIDLLELDKLKN